MATLAEYLTHGYLIQAAAQGVALHSLAVEVTGQIDQRAGEAGYEAVPREPHGIAYTVHLDTSASDEAVERLCPALNLLRRPQAVSGPVRRAAAPNAARALSPEGAA